MARTRTGPTLVEVIVILAVSAGLFILLTLTVNRVCRTLAAMPTRDSLSNTVQRTTAPKARSTKSIAQSSSPQTEESSTRGGKL